MPAQDGQFIVDRYGRRLLDDQGRFMVHDSAAAPCCQPNYGTWCAPCEYEVPRSWIVTISGMDVSKYPCIFLDGYPQYDPTIEVDGTLNTSFRLSQQQFGSGCNWWVRYPREFSTYLPGGIPCDPNQPPYPGDAPHFVVKRYLSNGEIDYCWLAHVGIYLQYVYSSNPELQGYYWRMRMVLGWAGCDPRTTYVCNPCLWSGWNSPDSLLKNICANPTDPYQVLQYFPFYQQYKYRPGDCLRELVFYDDRVYPTLSCYQRPDVYCSGATIGTEPAVATLQPEF